MSLQHTLGRYDIAAQEDRSAPRTKLAIPAQLRASGARAFQTVVNDLSLSGFSATAITRMHPGAVCLQQPAQPHRPRQHPRPLSRRRQLPRLILSVSSG